MISLEDIKHINKNRKKYFDGGIFAMPEQVPPSVRTGHYNEMTPQERKNYDYFYNQEDYKNTVNEMAKTAGYMIPVVGTGIAAYDFYKNPSLYNGTMLGMSALGDAFEVANFASPISKLFNSKLTDIKLGNSVKTAFKDPKRIHNALYQMELNKTSREMNNGIGRWRDLVGYGKNVKNMSKQELKEISKAQSIINDVEKENFVNSYFHETNRPWNSSGNGTSTHFDENGNVIPNTSKVFLSYGYPWDEFKGTKTIHEFPFETFGERSSADWNGVPTGVGILDVFNGYKGPNLNYIRGKSHPGAKYIDPNGVTTGNQIIVLGDDYVDAIVNKPHITRTRQLIETPYGKMPYTQTIHHIGKTISNSVDNAVNFIQLKNAIPKVNKGASAIKKVAKKH